jgi:hypothetical protein
LSFRNVKYFVTMKDSGDILRFPLPYTRPVRGVSSHFEHLENRSRGRDVAWEPLRGELTVHPWTVTLPWD